ncbi:MAG: HAD family hydrolase [Candidatus Ranarchaeia archaeon]
MNGHLGDLQQRRWYPTDIHWLFFDFFGTLYRMVPTPLTLCKQLLRRVGGHKTGNCNQIIKIATVADNFVYRAVEKNKVNFFESAVELPAWQPYLDQLRKLTGLGVTQAKKFFMQWHNHWKTPGDQVRPFHDALKIVSELANRGFRLGVLSNGEWDLEPILRRDGFSEFIKLSISSGEIGVQKPDERIFMTVCNLVKAKPSQCALIGDTIETDIEGAKKAGWLPIFLCRPKRKYTKKITGKVLVIPSLHALLNHFIALEP